MYLDDRTGSEICIDDSIDKTYPINRYLLSYVNRHSREKACSMRVVRNLDANSHTHVHVYADQVNAGVRVFARKWL